MTDDTLRAAFEAVMRAPPYEWDEDEFRVAHDDSGEYLHYETRMAFVAFCAGHAAGARGDARGFVTVTTNEAGEAVAVTRTDDENRILDVIWERAAIAAKGKP